MRPRPPPSRPLPARLARTSLGGWQRSWCSRVLLAYSGSLHAPFVYDDTLAIPENETIRRLWPLTDVLWPQAEGGLTVSGRPMLNLSFAINYAISGTKVWSYHVFNILVHAGSALLLFGIARRTFAAEAQTTFPPGASASAAAAPRHSRSRRCGHCIRC